MSRAAAPSSAPRSNRPGRLPRAGFGLDSTAILYALAEPVLAVDARRIIRYVNQQAEAFFDSSAAHLVGSGLYETVPFDCPLFSMIDQVLSGQHSMAQDGILIDTPRTGRQIVSAQVTASGTQSNAAVILLHQRSLTSKIDNQLTHRHAARSVTAMASMPGSVIEAPAAASASATTGSTSSTWARPATSGTTPPKAAWRSIWLDTTDEMTRSSSSTTAAAVSSQLVSSARIRGRLMGSILGRRRSSSAARSPQGGRCRGPT